MVEENKIVEQQIVEEQIVEQQPETQAEQIVENPFQTFKEKIEAGSRKVEDVLYSDHTYFSL